MLKSQNNARAEIMLIYTFYDIGDETDKDFRTEMEIYTLNSLLNREWITKEYIGIINRIIQRTN